MSLPAVAALVSRQTIEHSLVRGSLKLDIYRGVNLQSALVDLIGAVFVFEVAADLLDEVGSERIGIVREMQDQWRRAGVGGLGSGDLAVFEHGVDHEIAALLCPIGMVDG